MLKPLLLTLLVALLIPATAGAYAVDNITQTTGRVSGLTCGTKYRVRVERAQGTGWTALETFTPTTAACTPPPPAPTANFAVDPNPAVRTQATTFTSTGTCAATPCSYIWVHGDATSTEQIGTGTTASFTYTGPVGPRTVTLKVTDSLNRTATKTTTFQLVEPTQPPPADGDGDGVPDSSDDCPGTTPGTPVDSHGCPLTIPPPPGGFPDATNTGVPDGTVLTKKPGFQVSTDNAVIDGVETDGIDVNAKNVTIKNSYIHGSTIWGVQVEPGASVTVQDTTINGENDCFEGIAYGNYTALRDDISGCENGVSADSNSTVRDSWIHDLSGSSTAHNDGVQGEAGATNVVIDHNRIEARDTSAIIMYTKTDAAQNTNWQIINNYLKNPDNIDLYCPRVNTTNIVVTNNTFVKPSNSYTDSCVPGHVTTWSGNVDSVTGASIPQQ